MATDGSQMTAQVREWTGDFGREYTDRNDYTTEQLDELYRLSHGTSRRELNQRFLDMIPRNARILEVGCNIGTQLLILKEMDFTDLSGVEIQSYAVQRAKERLGGAQILSASATLLPFADQEFDLVFTSGVLIHIAPLELPAAMAEIHRCTKKWIWGMEYYAPKMTGVIYRGNGNLLWKADYPRLYQDQFADLELVREERLPFLKNENVNTMFLLRRRV